MVEVALGLLVILLALTWRVAYEGRRATSQMPRLHLGVKAIFVAHKHVEAAYWAQKWGFERHEWLHVRSPSWYSDLHGLYGAAPSVFFAGSVPMKGALMQLELYGFDTFIDAHDHPTDPESQSALPVFQGNRISRTVRPM